ncbi:MAG: VOC family protein [Clostridia bacterium]|nr:VOC family protein [Clostridia bacterium]
MAGALGTLRLAQVGFIVRDIEKTKVKFAELFGMPVPPTCDGGEFAVTGTTVMGQPAPEANCKMAFFDLENVQLELIEPNGVKSTWQDFLDTHGEGIHHIAFGVKGTDRMILNCEALGMQCVQRGKYGDGSGEYAYMDATEEWKCFIETLESFQS